MCLRVFRRRSLVGFDRPAGSFYDRWGQFTVGTDDGNTCATFQARFGDDNETFTALKEPLCGRGWESHIFLQFACAVRWHHSLGPLSGTPDSGCVALRGKVVEGTQGSARKTIYHDWGDMWFAFANGKGKLLWKF